VHEVIDFSVVKATGGELTRQTIETGFGSVVGTSQSMNAALRLKQRSVAVRRPIRVGWFRNRRSAEGARRLV
jgi:hypothetical protein